jgi:hypothetical protein
MVTPGDDRALQEKVRWVLDHPDAVSAMRPAVRHRAVARVSESAVAAALRDCFAAAGVKHLESSRGATG